MKLKKFWPLIGVMCIGWFAPSFADNYHAGSSYTSGSMQQTDQGMNQRGGAYREITPAAGPRVAHGADIFLYGDFIYWRAVQEGSTYINADGLKNGETADLLNSVPKGEQLSFGAAWRPGFKVGLGANLSHDGWDMDACFTQIRPKKTGASKSDIVSPLKDRPSVSFATKETFIGTTPIHYCRYMTPINFATFDWHLHHRTLDFSLGRNCYLSPFFTIRPSIGVKGVWQEQEVQLAYVGTSEQGFQGGQASSESPILSRQLTGPYYIKEHFEVRGIGTRLGLNLAYHVVKGLCLYSNMHVSGLWMNYHNHFRQDVVVDTKASSNENNDDGSEATPEKSAMVNYIDKSKVYVSKCVGEFEAGARCDLWFYDDGYHAEVQLGWEQQTYFNWTNFINFFNEEHWDSLSFYGLTAKFRLDF